MWKIFCKIDNICSISYNKDTEALYDKGDHHDFKHNENILFKKKLLINGWYNDSTTENSLLLLH